MKKKKIFILGCLFCLLTITILFAEEVLPPSQPVYGPLRKLGRGLQNITIGFPFQLFKDVEDTYKQDGVVAAGTAGAIKGLAKGTIRLFTGLYETLTFIFPIPEDYKPIMNDPEFFLQTDPEFPEDAPVVDSSDKE
ncbi:MAG: exosortase system-associated protein, TIGR04073 family [Candidatus Omnitrophota bacterium]